MRHKILFLILAATLLAAGCRSHRQMASSPEPDTTQVTPPRIADTIATPAVDTTATSKPAQPDNRNKWTKRQTFSGSFTCKVNGMNVNGIARIQYDSVIWLCVNKFVELGRVRITHDSVVLYLRYSNQHLRCTMKELTQRFHIDADFWTLQGALLGWPIESKHIQCMPSQYYTVGNLMFAKELNINITHPRMRQSLLLKYSNIELDKPLSLPLSIPRSATPITIK